MVQQGKMKFWFQMAVITARINGLTDFADLFRMFNIFVTASRNVYVFYTKIVDFRNPALRAGNGIMVFMFCHLSSSSPFQTIYLWIFRKKRENYSKLCISSLWIFSLFSLWNKILTHISFFFHSKNISIDHTTTAEK